MSCASAYSLVSVVPLFSASRMTLMAFATSGVMPMAISRMVSAPGSPASCARYPVMAYSSISAVPESGSSWFRMTLNRVDLPAPFGPTRATRSPQLMVIFASSKRVLPPTVLVRFLIVSTAVTCNEFGMFAMKKEWAIWI